MTLAFLVFTLLWDPVYLDCHGGMDEIVSYQLIGIRGDSRDALCYDQQGQPFVCQETVRTFIEPPEWKVEAPETSLVVDLGAYNLPIGSFVAMPTRIVAIDSAGNRSGEACPP